MAWDAAVVIETWVGRQMLLLLYSPMEAFFYSIFCFGRAQELKRRNGSVTRTALSLQMYPQTQPHLPPALTHKLVHNDVDFCFSIPNKNEVMQGRAKWKMEGYLLKSVRSADNRNETGGMYFMRMLCQEKIEFQLILPQRIRIIIYFVRSFSFLVFFCIVAVFVVVCSFFVTVCVEMNN